jgi:hypothetical protein
MSDKATGRSRGFGYVDFSNAESCNAALESMQGFELEGRAMNLDLSKPRPAENANPRDRASDRAQKHGDTVSPESDTLFVGNLPFDADEDMVTEFFNEVAEVKSLRLPTDPYVIPLIPLNFRTLLSNSFIVIAVTARALATSLSTALRMPRMSTTPSSVLISVRDAELVPFAWTTLPHDNLVRVVVALVVAVEVAVEVVAVASVVVEAVVVASVVAAAAVVSEVVTVAASVDVEVTVAVAAEGVVALVAVEVVASKARRSHLIKYGRT